MPTYGTGYDPNQAVVAIGEANDDVAAIQRWLIANYPYAATVGLSVTGTYDEPTAAVIRQWKADHPGYGGDPKANVFIIPRSALDSNQRQPDGAAAKPGTAQADAQAQIKMYLDQWGLGSLAEWAWGQLSQGKGSNEIMLDLRNQEAYKARFAGNLQRSAKGLTPLSEERYLAYETQARQMMRAAGLPEGFYDQPEDFAGYIANDVSVSELAGRVQAAQDYAAQDPTVNAQERAELLRLYGVGGTAAYYLDPTKALPVLNRQLAAAQSAAAASRAGFGALSRSQAERVAGLSPSIQQTAQAFSALAAQRELMRALPGELGVDVISADEQINAALGGDAIQSERISRRARKRVADFQAQQGDYAKGLGTSTTLRL